MPYLSLTTWSLHRNLGPLRWTRWDDTAKKHTIQEQPQPETIPLLLLPAALAAKNFEALEICHFHFPRTDDLYLHQLRVAFTKANMAFYTLLIDYGDISSSDATRRNADIEFIETWIDIAAKAGAERVRIVAGESAPHDTEALARSAEALKHLADYAKQRGVRVITENFRELASNSVNCLHLLQACDHEIGLTSDFGNFAAPGKYAELEKIIPFSESVHAKANYDASGYPDVDEFIQCMDVVRQTGYEGPITLVYDGAGDMWKGIERVQKLVEPYLI